MKKSSSLNPPNLIKVRGVRVRSPMTFANSLYGYLDRQLQQDQLHLLVAHTDPEVSEVRAELKGLYLLRYVAPRHKSTSRRGARMHHEGKTACPPGKMSR